MFRVDLRWEDDDVATWEKEKEEKERGLSHDGKRSVSRSQGIPTLSIPFNI